jgi:hypothetical protein
MVSILQFIVASALTLQALIGLAFFISSVWEKETRASVFAGLQFGGMLALVGLFFF